LKNLRNFYDWSINESNSDFYIWAKPPSKITPAQKKQIELKASSISSSSGLVKDLNFSYSDRYWGGLKNRLTQNSIKFKYGNTSAIPKQWIYWGEKVIYSDKRALLSRNSDKDEVLAYYPLAYNGTELNKFWVVAFWKSPTGKIFLREMTLNTFLTKSTRSLIQDYMSGITKEGINVVNSFIDSVKSSYKIEESPRGSNKGPTVNPILRKVNVNPGDPWCAAFVYDIFSKTSFDSTTKSKIPNKASVKMHWDNTKGKKIPINSSVLANPTSYVKSGMVFFYLTDVAKGKGHTGIVLSVTGKSWYGIEGNTNPLSGSREGYGAFLAGRHLKDGKMGGDPNSKSNTMLGFVDYFDSYRNIFFDSYMQAKIDRLISEIKPKTTKEIAFLKSNPKVLDTYAKNYKNRYNS
jgi:hypothetical protein